MKNKVMIKEELTEFLDEYYNSSFSQMVCDYIRSSGMTPHEIKEMLAAMRLVVCINTL
jgi:hypothetical protein